MLQAINREESTENHEDIFKAFCHMWTLTHADAPALRDVLVHVAKDGAPGIEAARKTIFPKSRPVDDFFHFMGKETELTAKCEIMAVTDAGKHYKMNCDCIRSVLYDIQNTPTADLVNLIWKGFLMRLLCMGEVDVALYLWTSYSKEYHVSTLWNMGVFTNATNREDTLHFLSWWSGFDVSWIHLWQCQCKGFAQCLAKRVEEYQWCF